MNSNDSSATTFEGGTIIPNVLIDNFKLLEFDSSINYCFISHAHSDHYQYLDVPLPHDNVKYILTKTTQLAILNSSYPNSVSKERIRWISTYKVNEQYSLEPRLEFVLIPNYHCVGSVMILLIDKRGEKPKNVLYTGDARFSASVLGCLSTNHKLSSFIHGNGKLNLVYLDTTFSYRDDLIDIVDNNRGIQLLLDTIRQYPSKTTFIVSDSIRGFEEIYFRIQQEFKSVATWEFNCKLKKRIEMINSERIDNEELMINVLNSITALQLYNEPREFKYHFIFGKPEKEENIKLNIKENNFVVNIKHAINLAKDDYFSFHVPINSTTNTQFKFNHLSNELWLGTIKVRQFTQDVEYKFPYYKRNEIFYPTELKCMYSRHSSYRETKSFINLFKGNIDDIWPCTEGPGSRSKNWGMKRLYGLSNSLYDEKWELFEDDEPIHVLNLWDRKSELVESVLGTIHILESKGSEISKGSMTDVDVDDETNDIIEGKHKRTKLNQPSITEREKLNKQGWRRATVAKGESARTRDMVRYSHNRVKTTDWIVTRKVYKKAL
ncbi:hypothetical protein DAMA08_028730 [Martiniozyma asiatica (nom. inval.)]|nr:hypothetical protein DAMA08_028730 [Martiniozyma asiatica]